MTDRRRTTARRAARGVLRLAAAFAVFLGLSACRTGDPPDAMPAGIRDLSGRTVGSIRFSDANGQTSSFDEPGKLYLVDFMAIGCKGCMEELPDLLRLQRDLAGPGTFQLVLVVYGWKGRQLLDAARYLGVGDFPLYADTEDVLGRLEVKGWPTSFLLRDGRILKHHVGGSRDAYERWKRIVEAGGRG